MKQLGDIAGVFAYLSLLTVGGGMAAFPELKTLTVDSYHWVTFPELLHFYSLGQLAPGPNMMMVASIGAVVAGLPGAAVALVAFFLLAVAIICVAVIIITLHGPHPFEVFGHSVSLNPPRRPLTVAWALLFIRLAIAWYRHRAGFDAWLGPVRRAIFYWHAVPIGVFLLLPGRLQFFLMYISPANSFPDQQFDPLLGAWLYVYWLATEYHVAPWSWALAIVLVDQSGFHGWYVLGMMDS